MAEDTTTEDLKEFIKEYNKELDEAMARIDAGIFVSMEDVEREAKEW